MALTKAEKITSIDVQIEQLKNQQKRLIQEEKERERKERTKRLCRRMGLFESMLPDTIPLSEEQFKTFLEKALLSDSTRRILDGLTAQGNTTATPIRASAAAQSAPTPASQPAQTEQDGATDGGEERGNGARVNG